MTSHLILLLASALQPSKRSRFAPLFGFEGSFSRAVRRVGDNVGDEGEDEYAHAGVAGGNDLGYGTKWVSGGKA